MTFSNGQFNPNPLANPFNTRLGPANYTLNPHGTAMKSCFTRNANATLPEARPVETVPQQDLTTPNQLEAPPVGYAQFDRVAYEQMHPDYFVAPDGSTFDLKSRKMVSGPKTASTYGANDMAPYRMMPNHFQTLQDEHENICIGNPNVRSSSQNDFQHQYDAQLQKQKDELEKKPMSDLQKQLLADLENGQIAGCASVKSKLELVESQNVW